MKPSKTAPLKKICGITNLVDAEMVSSYFPEYIGFIFHPKSPRNISFHTFTEISDSIRVCFNGAGPKLVGVLVNPNTEFVQKLSPYGDVFQFHGDESPEFCRKIKEEFPQKKVWKALKISEENAEEELQKISQYKQCDGILLDAFSQDKEGGTGKRIPKNILPFIKKAKEKQRVKNPQQILLIAGGVTAENYQSILNKTSADGVDLSSSLEKNPGKKSGKKVERFFCG